MESKDLLKLRGSWSKRRIQSRYSRFAGCFGRPGSRCQPRQNQRVL